MQHSRSASPAPRAGLQAARLAAVVTAAAVAFAGVAVTGPLGSAPASAAQSVGTLPVLDGPLVGSAGGVTNTIRIYDVDTAYNGDVTLAAPKGTTFNTLTNNIGSKVTIAADRTTATMAASTYGKAGATISLSLAIPAGTAPATLGGGSAVINNGAAGTVAIGTYSVTVQGSLPVLGTPTAPAGSTTNNVNVYDVSNRYTGVATLTAPTGTTFDSVSLNNGLSFTLSPDRRTAISPSTTFGMEAATISFKLAIPSGTAPGLLTGGAVSISNGTAVVAKAALTALVQGGLQTTGTATGLAGGTTGGLTVTDPDYAYTGTATLTAPAGTTFAQVEAAGAAATISADGRTATLDRATFGKGGAAISISLKIATGTPAGALGGGSVQLLDNGLVLARGSFGATVRDPKQVAVLTPTSGATLTGTTQAFTGTGEPGAIVQIKDDLGDILATATVRADGSWSAIADLPAGANALTVVQTPGAASGVSLAVTVSPTTAPPTTPVAPLVVTAPATTSTAKAPVFAGTGQPGARIQVKGIATGAVIAETTVAANGTWSATSTRSFDNGTALVFTVVQTADSEVSTVSVSFSIKTIAVLKVSSPAGTSAETAPVFTGSGEPGALIQVKGIVTGAVIAEATVDAKGAWSATSTRAFANGAALVLDVVQTAGSSTSTVQVGFTIAKPAALAVTAPNGSSAAKAPVFAGTGQPGATIQVKGVATGAVIAQVVVAADGTWTATSTKTFASGDPLRFDVVQTVGGSSSVVSVSFSIA